MIACAAAGAVVISKTAGAMFSNEALPVDEALLQKNERSRVVEKVDVTARTTKTEAPPPSD